MDWLSVEELERARLLLGQRPPDAVFTAAEAAIYTGRSTRTLKRAIDAGVGPKREKNPDASGLGATNRHTRYRKVDLDQWRESLVAYVTDFRDFDDLAVDAPWVMEEDKLVGHLLQLADVEAMLVALGSESVIFLRLDEALRRAWASADRRRHYQNAFEAICREAMRTAAEAAQQDDMEEETGPAPGGSKGPVRP